MIAHIVYHCNAFIFGQRKPFPVVNKTSILISLLSVDRMFTKLIKTGLLTAFIEDKQTGH